MKGMVMRRSDIISIIMGLCYIATVIWGASALTTKVESCSSWVKQNEKLPACVEANAKWIDLNKNLPSAVLTNQIDLRYFGKEMEKLTNQLEAVNKNLTWFKNYRKGSTEKE